MKQHGDAQKKDLRKAARTLSEALLSLETPAEARAFLEDLCTPAELEAMVDRWRTAALLREGRSYREISELLGIEDELFGEGHLGLGHDEGLAESAGVVAAVSSSSSVVESLPGAESGSPWSEVATWA